LITLIAYTFREGIDDGLAEFGVNENIEVRMTISAPPIMVNNIPLFILCDRTLRNLKSL
jgi:hypothetical protein